MVVSAISLVLLKDAGAGAMFGGKYDVGFVRAFHVPCIFMYLCGGTHVTDISGISLFKSARDSETFAGVSRVEAVCGASTLPYLAIRDQAVRLLGDTLKNGTGTVGAARRWVTTGTTKRVEEKRNGPHGVYSCLRDASGK